jgi:ADP-ribose pyrophosphatase YjhB (NUDIX family)
MVKFTEKSNWEGQEITYTWLSTSEIKNYIPVTQVYGVCINEDGKILIIKDKCWQIPGGTPENGETAEETLRRELVEEVQVEVEKLIPLGVQEVKYPNNPNKEQGELFYQYRYLAIITKLNPTAPDPATGREYERKFVSFDEIDEYVKWGGVGTEMFKDARVVFQEMKK